jgi:hypothetical protein
MVKQIVLLALLTLVTINQGTYKKFTPGVDKEAVCLDGSPSSVYVHQGS